jgi:hypothetical protein
MSSFEPENFIKITKVQALNNLETPTGKVGMDDVLYLKHNGMYTDLGTLSEVKSRTHIGTEFRPEFTNNLYLKKHDVPSLSRLSMKNISWKDANSLTNVDLPPNIRRFLPTEVHTKSEETSNYENKRRRTHYNSSRRARSRNMRVRRTRSRNSRLRRARSRKALRK